MMCLRVVVPVLTLLDNLRLAIAQSVLAIHPTLLLDHHLLPFSCSSQLCEICGHLTRWA
jgi:hypothetical protein